jgi:hypothetical protein
MIACSKQVSNVEEEHNIYGGRTIERTFDENEILQGNYSKIIQYFDSQDKIIKEIVTPIDSIINETGIKEQIQYYKNDIIEKYEMFFTDKHKSVYGFNRLIEEVNVDGEIIKIIWYNNNIELYISNTMDDGFMFYNIEFLEDEYFEGYEPNEKGDVISISARYIRTKSVIKFGSELVELDVNDYKNMDALASSFGFQNMNHLYSKKIKVYSENRSYWLYVQAQLEQYILGQSATIRYYPIGKNKELYLICVGFYDID